MDIRYAESDEVSLAYAIEGDADLRLIYIPGIVSNLALDPTFPIAGRFYERLAQFSRFVRWDRRGTGLSDLSAEPLPLAEQHRDLEAVRCSAGFDRFALVSFSQGTALAARYAAMHPERVSHLVLIGGIVCGNDDLGDPLSPAHWTWDHLIDGTRDFATFTMDLVRLAAPSLDPNASRTVANSIKASISPVGMRQLLGQIRDLDLRALLSDISVPTLVIHCSRDALITVTHGRYFAEHIPGARFVEVDSDFHLFMTDSNTTAVTLTALEEFLTGHVVHSADRTMTTVLFTDIVDSTAAQQRVGDEVWRTLRKSFEAGSTRLVEQYGGRVVQFTGDGVMAAFSSASQALRAARALAADARGHGVAIRAGVHAGEAYLVEDQLFGTCVTVASRVADHAGAGEIYTTETVKDLVSGAGFTFRDAGVFELKGLGSRRLMAVD